jgi:hypothetical protein
MRIIRTGTINLRRTKTTKKNRRKWLISVGSNAPGGAASLSTVPSLFILFSHR